MTLGTVIRARRGDMNLSLESLARVLDGSPGQTFLSRVERDKVGISPDLAHKLAKALRLPEDDVLRAAGLAPERDVVEALERLREKIGTPTLRESNLLVHNANGTIIGRRKRLTWGDTSNAFLVELTDPSNAPFVGEILVLADSLPKNGQGVVAEIGARWGAYTYRAHGRGTWIEDGRGGRVQDVHTILGVISRVTSERHFDNHE